MLCLVLSLSTALAAPPPAALVMQVIDELPDDYRLHTLHWDGRRVWVSGEGLRMLTEDGQQVLTGWPVKADSSLGIDILAGPGFSTAEMPRQDAIVLGLSAPGLQVDHSAPLVLEAADVWLDEPDYAADLVHIRGLADSARALRRLEQVAALSPCLADSRVSPHELERLPIAFTLTARSMGDLRSPDCAPNPTPTAVFMPKPGVNVDDGVLELRASWPEVWGLLSEADGVPLDSFTIRADGDALVVRLKHFEHHGAPSSKDRKALDKHVGRPTEALVAQAKQLPPHAPDTLAYDMLGGDAPRGASLDTLQTRLVDEHRQRLHEALSVLDSTMVDLQAFRLYEVRQTHRQVAELVFDIRLLGPEDQIEANLKELELPGVELVEFRPEDARLPAFVGDLPPGAHTFEGSLTVSVPVLPGAPRAATWADVALPTEAPANPFARGPAWDARKAEIDELLSKKDPLLLPKAWHIEYLGHLGTAMPRGLVRMPDGTVRMVRQGDRIGDAWAPVIHLGDTALQLRLEYTQLDGNDVRREVELPAAPHPPDEAPVPSTHLATLDGAALVELRGRFPDGNALNIDIIDAELAAVLHLFSLQGVPTTIDESLRELPAVTMHGANRSVGDLLTELQVVLLDHGLVFDDALVLRHNPTAARALRDSLLAGDKVSVGALPEGPLVQAPSRGVRVHLAPVAPVDLMRLLKVAHLSTTVDVSVSFSDEEATPAQLLAALDARLDAAGWQLVVTENSVLVLKR